MIFNRCHSWRKLYSWQRPHPNMATKSILRPGQGVGGGQVIWPCPPSWDVWETLTTKPNDREWIIGCTDSFIDKHGYCPTTYVKVNHNLKKHTHMCLYPGHTKCVCFSHFNTFLFHFYIYLISLKSLVMQWKQQLICCSVWITVTDLTLEWLMQVQMKFSISNLQGQLSCWLSPSQLWVNL